MAENAAQQAEELEALVSIYDNWKKDPVGENSYSIEINSEVTLFLFLCSEYPSKKPPEFQLLAPILTRTQKEQISNTFEEIYRDNLGEPIIFQWIEKLKEIVTVEENLNPGMDEPNVIETNGDLKIDYKEKPLHQYDIIHGSTIQDRKSTFQGHACFVNNQEQVKEVMALLLQNKKVAQATHNILAYRILLNTSVGSILQDCDDDGENHAGGRVLHLLQIVNAVNVMVVVSRWYGGIQLGPDRFRHINNAARQVLQQGGFIKSS